MNSATTGNIRKSLNRCMLTNNRIRRRTNHSSGRRSTTTFISTPNFTITMTLLSYGLMLVLFMMEGATEAATQPEANFPFELLEPRIVGGTVAALNKYPYYGFPASPYNCGATVIWNDIMVSAAHCSFAFTQAGVLVGGNTIDGKSSTYYSIAQAVVHPDYNNSTYVNDIVLFKLNGNVPGPFAQINVNPAIPADNDEVTVIGYGNIAEDGTYSTELMQVDLSTTDISACSKYFHTFFDPETMLCIGGGRNDIGQDACQGDSGGPLFVKGSHHIVGLVSFGDGCARVGVPSVNTRISSFSNWIETTICAISSYAPKECANMHVRSTSLHDRIESLTNTTVKQQRSGAKTLSTASAATSMLDATTESKQVPKPTKLNHQEPDHDATTTGDHHRKVEGTAHKVDTPIGNETTTIGDHDGMIEGTDQQSKASKQKKDKQKRMLRRR